MMHEARKIVVILGLFYSITAANFGVNMLTNHEPAKGVLILAISMLVYNFFYNKLEIK